ncbi:MAG: SPOR domain-containing protein [Hydrogenophaga sp.]|uniref:SPOR domain-containing protein n=1 Tax=Hydrogenophaga sp. TaxID=1904254 RepID=UPI0026391837|nr:SPOR domain-containing protein [Hydrogenophaga sp.]MCV0441331.1 SPOR domain-containing protein [Hydrogenophaga sp.]
MTAATPQPAATEPESATTALYRAALGPVNTDRYLDVFARFDEAGRASPAWNAAAGWLTLNWMVFRQLWGAALVYLVCAGGLAVLVVGLGRHVLQWPQSVEWGVLGALLLLSIAVPGAYGSALLHADIRRRMTRAVSEARTVREACATLEKQASSRRRLWGLVVLNVLLLAVGGYAAMDTSWRTRLAGASDADPTRAAPAEATAAPTPAASAESPAPPVAAEVIAEPLPAPAPAPGPAPMSVSLPDAGEVAPQAAPPQPPSMPAPAPAGLESSPRSAPPPPLLAPRAAKRAVDAAPQAHGINVGLFADRTNAERAQSLLIEAGFPAILQNVDHPKGQLTRVRVGPFASRQEADEAAARIRAMGLDAMVFRP